MPFPSPDLYPGDLTFPDGQLPAAARLYARFEPLAYDDANQGNAFKDLTSALAAPVEIGEITRDAGAHIAWSALRDPDFCPEALLDWLAVDQGIVLPQSALTANEKRYRIKQAAGRYRGTPRALAEEIQLELAGSKTVLLSYQVGDEWHYLVGTIDSETSDSALVEAAIARQNPAFMLGDYVSTSTWSWFVLAPTLIAERDVDGEYTLGTPDYPTWTSVTSAFTDWTDLVAGP